MSKLLVSLVFMFFVSINVNAAVNEEIKIINSSNKAVWTLHVSKEGVSTWSADVLGGTIISPGETQSITFNDGTKDCYYEIKAIARDKSYWENRNFNVCKRSSWTLGN